MPSWNARPGVKQKLLPFFHGSLDPTPLYGMFVRGHKLLEPLILLKNELTRISASAATFRKDSIFGIGIFGFEAIESKKVCGSN